MSNQSVSPETIEILGSVTPEFAEILTPEAMNFVATLVTYICGEARGAVREKSAATGRDRRWQTTRLSS